MGTDEKMDVGEHYGHHCENCGKRLGYGKELRIQTDGTVLCEECEGMSPEERAKHRHPDL